MKSVVFSHKGKREINQDFVLVQNMNPETSLLLIADGMGGYNHGEIAAQLVAENILVYLSTVKVIDQSPIQKAVNKANLAIRQFKEKNKTSLGATVGGIILQSNLATCFWVGDVKIYHFKKKKLVFESYSHTLINQLKENGSIVTDDRIDKYRHIVTRSIHGQLENSQISYQNFDNITEDDLFIICSDGVHDLLDGMQIQEHLSKLVSVEQAVNEIEIYLQKHASDNFSLIALYQ